MSIYVTGDTHGEIDIGKLSNKKWPEGKSLSRNDYLIIAGDFGVIWKDQSDSQEKYLLKFLNERKYTVLVVDGNHDNIPRLKRLPEIPMFDDFVRIIDENVFYLQRGHVYTIEGRTLFTMGGGLSIDKDRRISGISWWHEEIPSYEEFYLGVDNLKRHNNKVDLIITHATFEEAYNKLPFNGFGLNVADKYNDPMHKMLSSYRNSIEYDKWLFGHYHFDIEMPALKARCLYNDIVRV